MSTNIKTLVVYLDAYVTLAFNCQRTLETSRFPRTHAASPKWARKLLAFASFLRPWRSRCWWR